MGIAFDNLTPKSIRREIIALRQLSHPNVLQLIGVYADSEHPLSIITRWLDNGTAKSYLKQDPAAFTNIVSS